MPNRTIGRPPLPEDERRGARLDIRFTEAEREMVVAASEKDGKPPSVWARERLLASARKK